jgi:anti-sigma factor RsiW
MSAPTNTCKRYSRTFQGYLDGELDTTACDAIDRHCQECASCAALVNGLRDTVGLCRQAATAPLPDAVRQRARESVRRLLDRHGKES